MAALTAEDWTAIGTGVTAAVAVLAAGFAALQVREVRRTREDQTRPFVIVDIQPGPAWSNLLDLVVENIGSTAARDVQISFDPPLRQSKDDGYPIAESALIREGIRMLPPGRRIRVFFDASHHRIKTDLPMRYDVTFGSRTLEVAPSRIRTTRSTWATCTRQHRSRSTAFTMPRRRSLRSRRP